ncbi:hypothetical protein MNBD_NITROSPINAE01-1593 [hydrothermal vent metagenome]|uniref:GIY-YIG domain-containing protein n=1 Tax=hydrothermal vent metagenome TaxID=652676 RepID=A0A3B1CLE3_9ZZZZ
MHQLDRSEFEGGSQGIFWWVPWELTNVPAVGGVYCLRDINQTIVYIAGAKPGELREKLNKHFKKNDIPDVYYFDWYQTSNEYETDVVKQEWIAEFKPKHNIQPDNSGKLEKPSF